MYKQSGLLVIAALVIASMGILAPTATVTAVVPTPDVAATAPTVTLAETTSRDNGYVWFTLTVTNPTDSENIRYIIVKDITSGVSRFDYGIGGENVSENIDNFADNLTAAGNELYFVADNFEEAVVNLQRVGDLLIIVADNLQAAGEYMALSLRDNLNSAGSEMKAADDYIRNAGNLLKGEAIDFNKVTENLHLAAIEIGEAGVHVCDDTANDGGAQGPQGHVQSIGNTFFEIANNLDNYIENALGNTVFWYAGDNQNSSKDDVGDNAGVAGGGFENVAYLFENIGKTLGEYTAADDDPPAGGVDVVAILDAANIFENYIFPNLVYAAENLRAAADNLVEAGTALRLLDNTYLENCEGFPLNTADTAAGDDTGITENTAFLHEKFLEGIDNAVIGLENGHTDDAGDYVYENLLVVGEALENAAENQNIWLGTELASNIIGYDGEVVKTSARYWLGQAGMWIKDNDNINMTAAASAFDNAGARFIAAGTQIKTIATGLTPKTGWACDTTTDVIRFEGVRDNRITPGAAAMTFKFMWLAPDIDVAEDYTFTVYTKDEDNGTLGQTNFTVSVDGKAPGIVDVTVTQVGVVDYLGNAVENVIGQVYDNAKATITITTSEAVTAFGEMMIENYAIAGENLTLTYAMFTADNDNMVFTYDFYTTDWIDNVDNCAVVIAGPCLTDIYGIENEEYWEENFKFDVIPPIFIENGLARFEELPTYLGMTKPGTDNDYYVTSVKRWEIAGRAEDNENVDDTSGDPDNDLWAITTIYINDVAQTMIRAENDDFSVTENLDEGVNVIKAKVVDRVGLSIENVLDNIFIDNTFPTVAGVTMCGETWTDNTLVVSENKITVRLKIQDLGWGIPWENVTVWLDDNADTNPYGAASAEGNAILLENNVEWDNGVCTGDYNFENLYDNDNKGIAAGTWYIIVEVTDNLHDNDNWIQAFTIDISVPTAPANVSTGVTMGTTAALREMITSTSISVTGYTAELDDGTIKIEKTTDNGLTWTECTTTEATIVQPGTDGNWSATLTVTAGELTGFRVKVKDKSGNWSSATTLGYVLADTTAPTVTISAAATSTEDASVAVTGAVTKNAWESYGDLTLTIQVGTSAVTVPILSDGTFSSSVELSVGTNTIIATVSDGVNPTSAASVNVTRTTAAAAIAPQATEYASYAIILVIVALILAAIAIFRKR